jgi:mRNA interferase MazF
MSFSHVLEYVPVRGNIIWLDFDPQAGHEQAKRRPALVLSPDMYNRKVGLAVVCPITSHSKRHPWEVAIPDGLEVNGFILSDQIKSLDWKVRKAAYICTLPQPALEEVINKLLTLFSLP